MIIDLSFTRFPLWISTCSCLLACIVYSTTSILVVVLTSISSSSFQLKSTDAAEYVELKPGVQSIDDATVSSGAAKGDVQKKITPWSNPGSIVVELFPGGSTILSPLPPRSHSGGKEDLIQCHRHTGDGTEREGGGGGLVLVASLLNKIPNLGGKWVVTKTVVQWHLSVTHIIQYG